MNIGQSDLDWHKASFHACAVTGPTWAFVDAVTAIGVQACVVDPRKTKLKAGFAAKTDRLDARRLADARRRESVVSIDIPPPAIRQLRERCRGRQQWVRLRPRVVQSLSSDDIERHGPGLIHDASENDRGRGRVLIWAE